MYVCTDCKKVFEQYKIEEEHHNLASPPYEKLAVCPHCGSGNIEERVVLHCRCCGARLPEGRGDYCNEFCRKRGLRLWKIEERRRSKRAAHPINLLLRELAEYNAKNGTEYSYGQYVAQQYLKRKAKKA